MSVASGWPKLRLAPLPILVWLAGVAPDRLHGWPAALPVFLAALALCVSACLMLIAFLRRRWRGMTAEAGIGALTLAALLLALGAMFDAWQGDKAGRTLMGLAFAISYVAGFWRYAVVALASGVLALLVAWHVTRPAKGDRGGR